MFGHGFCISTAKLIQELKESNTPYVNLTEEQIEEEYEELATAFPLTNDKGGAEITSIIKKDDDKH